MLRRRANHLTVWEMYNAKCDPLNIFFTKRIRRRRANDLIAQDKTDPGDSSSFSLLRNSLSHFRLLRFSRGNVEAVRGKSLLTMSVSCGCHLVISAEYGRWEIASAGHSLSCLVRSGSGSSNLSQLRPDEAPETVLAARYAHPRSGMIGTFQMRSHLEQFPSLFLAQLRSEG
jgi:hypothetical protein